MDLLSGVAASTNAEQNSNISENLSKYILSVIADYPTLKTTKTSTVY